MIHWFCKARDHWEGYDGKRLVVVLRRDPAKGHWKALVQRRGGTYRAYFRCLDDARQGCEGSLKVDGLGTHAKMVV